MTLRDFKTALLTLNAPVFRYIAPRNKSFPYIVWAEDSGHDFIADNKHVQRGYSGTIDLFTRTEDDALIDDVPDLLDTLGGVAYYLNTVQFEEDTGVIHYEWVFTIGKD